MEKKQEPRNGGNGKEKRTKIGDIMDTTLAKMREMADSDTIVGKPVTTPDGVTVIPVSKLTCGIGGGGSDYNTRHNKNQVLFGGGTGAGIDVTPVSFIVINNGKVEVLPASGTVAPPPPPFESQLISAIDKAADSLPGVIEKVEAFLEKQRLKKEAKKAAENEIPIEPQPQKE